MRVRVYNTVLNLDLIQSITPSPDLRNAFVVRWDNGGDRFIVLPSHREAWEFWNYISKGIPMWGETDVPLPDWMTKP